MRIVGDPLPLLGAASARSSKPPEGLPKMRAGSCWRGRGEIRIVPRLGAQFDSDRFTDAL